MVRAADNFFRQAMRQILCFVFVKYKPGTYYAHYVTNDSTIRKFHLLRCVCVCVVCACGVRVPCSWEPVVLTVTCF